MSAGSSGHFTLLRATGQQRMLYVAAALFLCVAAASWAAKMVWLSSDSDAAFLVFIGCLALALGGAFYAARAIRCPRCGLKWLFWSVSTQRYSQWLHSLLELGVCPQCGLSAGQVTMQANKSLERTRER
jgi:hypothetical protein